jgi:hypothetical protein
VWILEYQLHLLPNASQLTAVGRTHIRARKDHATLVNFEEPNDTPRKCALAATRLANDSDGFTPSNAQRYAINRGYVTVLTRDLIPKLGAHTESLRHALNRKKGVCFPGVHGLVAVWATLTIGGNDRSNGQAVWCSGSIA